MGRVAEDTGNSDFQRVQKELAKELVRLAGALGIPYIQALKLVVLRESYKRYGGCNWL